MNSQELREGRSEFIWEPNKRDFSGEDFKIIYIGPTPSLDHTYFNGIMAIDCAFDGTNLSNVEMAEAQIERCYFYCVDFSGSDLVGSQFRDAHFINCDFSEGEWRDSHFIKCKFTACNFSDTTVNLCIFEECMFSSESAVHFEQLCFTYNTFLKCEIDYRVNNDVVLSRNFALPAAQKVHTLTVNGQGITLEHACISSSYGEINIESLATAIENELTENNQRRLRKIRIEFITNIISQLALEHMISAPSLIYLEGLFSDFVRHVESDADFRIALSAVVVIRNAIYEATQIEDTHFDEKANCLSIEVTYKADLDVQDAENLAFLLTGAIPTDGARVRTQSVRKGSLIIDYVIDGALKFSAALMAINFALGQATKTIAYVGKLKKVTAMVVVPSKPQRRSQKSKDKLPAIERNGGLAKKMEQARTAVQMLGKKVTRLDHPTSVRIDLDR